MLFLTAISMGFFVGMMRSAFSVALVAFLMVATFILASVFSAGSTSYLSLLVAILGYNFGVLNFVAAMAAARRFRVA